MTYGYCIALVHDNITVVKVVCMGRGLPQPRSKGPKPEAQGADCGLGSRGGDSDPLDPHQLAVWGSL